MITFEGASLRERELIAKISDLEEVLLYACVASCDCHTKTPDHTYHVDGCKYKYYREALERTPEECLVNATIKRKGFR